MKLLGSHAKVRKANRERLGAVQVGWAIISIGLSALAGQLLKKDTDSPLDKDKPTTLATRGSYMSWHGGIRRIGPVFAWAGDRETRKESTGGGKGLGGGGGKQDIYFEAGWHQLCVGPCYGLHRIVQAGRTIFSGPITNISHPSGSTVDLGKEGSFTIYWGEPDQPVNSFLGDADRVSISSRWPHCCYVVWNKKRLGTDTNWPILDYIVERRPQTTLLSDSDSYYEPTAVLNGPTYNVIDFVANADENTGYLDVDGNATAAFDSGRIARVSGNGISDGDYIVLRTEVRHVLVATDPSGLKLYNVQTKVFFQGGTLGADDNGTIQAYTFSEDEGANIAHLKAEMLFESWPQGLGLDPDGPEKWDLDSLEELGIEAETEGWRSSILATDGEYADSIFGAMLQDHGVLLPIDTDSGMMRFMRVREPSGTLPNIPEDLFVEELPEIETLHGERKADRLVFEFSDREHDFGTMTIAIDSDGQASYLQHKRANEVPITSTVHFDTAAKLAEQRSQEELGGGGEFRLRLARGARFLIPGEAITAAGFEEVLRVTGVEFDPLAEDVTVTVVPDVYGTRRSDFENEPGGGNPNFEDPQLDHQYIWVELPEQLLPSEEMFLIVPRIRGNNQITSSVIHFSRDDSTYTLIGTQPEYATGGTLDADFLSSTKSYLAQGPEFTLLGPDASSALDLSADLTNWGLGRQIAVILSAAGTEICFVQKITAIAGSTYRLDGLLRARYDTRKLDHESSLVGPPQVYIFQDTSLRDYQDILLVPDEDLFVKSQPATSAGSVPIEAVAPFAQTLRGKGVVPIDVENLRTTAPHLHTNSYHTGDSVTVRWSYSTADSPNTGAGFQNAGTPVGDPSLKGSFIVELLTLGDVVVQTDIQNVPLIVYSNATLAAAPISEGSFKVRVRHSNNGYLSDPVELTITKL